MDGRCSSCKWWQKEPQSRDGAEGLFSVQARQTDTDWARCTYERDIDPGWKPMVADAADDYGVGLWTRSDFGCVCWEPKE